MTFVLDLCAMVLAQPRALFPALAYKVYGGGAGVVGLLQAAPAAGAVVAFLFSGWVSRVRLQGLAIVVAVIVYGAAVGGVGLTDVLWAGVVFLAISGMADMVSSAYRSTILQVAAPDELRGRLQGVFIVVVAGGPRAGDFLAGSVAAHTGERVALLLGGLACVVGRADRERAVARLPVLRRGAPDALTIPAPRVGSITPKSLEIDGCRTQALGTLTTYPIREHEDMSQTIQKPGKHAARRRVSNTPTTVDDGPMSHKQVLEALSGLLLGLFVAMLSSTVVSNALPRIVADLKGSESGYTWVVVATLLTMTASTPVWGKLADLFSKKLLVQTALVIFVIGSLASGLAPNMGSLIAARAFQGLGVGGLTALVQVVIASIVSPRERGRYSGYIGAVFALATVSGPLIGGFVVDSAWGWRGCFFVGLPVAVLAFVVLQKTLHVPTIKREVHIDYLGAILIAGGVSILLIWVSLAGHNFAWGSVTTAWMVALGVALLVGAVLTEMRAKEPIIPLRMFRDRTTSLATLASVMVGVAMFASTVYLSQYFQIAHGDEPHPRGPDVDGDGRRPAGLEHRHRPGDQPYRALEAVPGHRHGARGRRAEPAEHDRRDHQPGPGRRLHGGPGARPRRDHAEPRARGAEQHRPARHGCGQLRGRVLPLDGRLDRRLGPRRRAQRPGRRQRHQGPRRARRLGGRWQRQRHPGHGHACRRRCGPSSRRPSATRRVTCS